MTRQVTLMAPQRIDQDRKRSALQSDALAQLIGDGYLMDLQDISNPESWSVWWEDMLNSSDDPALVLIPDAENAIGFRQDQRAERAARMGVPVYILWAGSSAPPDDDDWRLTPRRDVDIRPIEPRSLSQFSYVIER